MNKQPHIILLLWRGAGQNHFTFSCYKICISSAFFHVIIYWILNTSSVIRHDKIIRTLHAAKTLMCLFFYCTFFNPDVLHVLLSLYLFVSQCSATVVFNILYYFNLFILFMFMLYTNWCFFKSWCFIKHFKQAFC